MNKLIELYHQFRFKGIIVHALIGLLLGYFILHPVSMVIYWFEVNEVNLTLANLFNAISENLQHAFKLHMMPMSVAFSALGLIFGFVLGIYSYYLSGNKKIRYIKKQVISQNIKTLIQGGENQYVEFKSSLRYDYRQVKTDKNLEHVILKSMAGFLNVGGGTLLIGVADNGKILGLQNDYSTLKKKNKDGFQQRIITLISNEFGKDICPNIHTGFYDLVAKQICAIFIERSKRPVYCKDGNRTIFYLRTGNVTNPLTTSETVEYLQNRKNTKI